MSMSTEKLQYTQMFQNVEGRSSFFPIETALNLERESQDEEDRGFNTVSVGIGSISSLDVPGEMPEASPLIGYGSKGCGYGEKL